LPANRISVVTTELVGIPLFVFCFAASVAVVILFEHGWRSRAERQMSSRVPLSDEAFGATYFPASWTKAASRIWHIVGEELDIDISRALPSDRFVPDLRIDDFDSLAAVTIVTENREGIRDHDHRRRGPEYHHDRATRVLRGLQAGLEAISAWPRTRNVSLL
jgi:hypothetical protein